MPGRLQTVQTFVKQKSPQCVWAHCMIHREVLASKKTSPGLNIVLTTVMYNHRNLYKNETRKIIFSALSRDMGAVHSIFYCEARWLSCEKFLQRVHELREAIAIFLEEGIRPKSKNFRDGFFLMKLSILKSIFFMS